MFNINFPEWDTDLFVYLNSKNLPWLDSTMLLLSSHTVWILICLIIIGLIIYRNRKEGKVASFFLVTGILMNSLLNNLIKLLFMRPRPGSEESLQDIIIQLEAVGNSYSFFSAHSSTSICLAVFTTLYFKNKIYGIFIFFWALAVAYSRIYVGKHYPLDVVIGIMFGLLTGYFSYWLYTRYQTKKLNVDE